MVCTVVVNAVCCCFEMDVHVCCTQQRQVNYLGMQEEGQALNYSP